MLYGWTKKQIDCAIERKTREIAEAVRRKEPPEKIYRLHEQQAKLERWREGSGNYNGN